MNPTFPRGVAALAVLACASGPAVAHVTLQRREAVPGAPYRGVLEINHGCAGEATSAVSVTIPEGLVGVRPTPKPGWTLSVVPATGGPAGAREITWSGGVLPDAHYDEFVFVGRVAGTEAPGGVLAFPVVQTCGAAAVRWTDVGPEGGAPSRTPAPLVRIVAGEGGRPSRQPMKAGDLSIEAPWIRATPGGARVAGGFLRVTNGGSRPDRLLGASIPAAVRGEVHETTIHEGIARMALVEGGLAIPPGASVDLKPGGHHLMFLDLSGPLEAGETVAGTLTFERAGTVPVTFEVGAAGASSPPGGGHVH